MNEDIEVPPSIQPNTDRVNGFAPGDRVAIVNCELAGAYGKVVRSRGGCFDECRDICRLVHVQIMSKPAVDVDTYRQAWAEGVVRFQVDEVVHVD